LAQLGCDAVLASIDLLAQGQSSSGIVQDAKLATKAPRLKKEDGLVDWSRSAVAIFNQVRALQPWPKTYTFWKPSGDESMRLILERVEPVDQPDAISFEAAKSAPGTVVVAEGDEFLVPCGEGVLRIKAIQPAGKKTMSPGDFLRGHRMKAGDRLG
jgi:methionyl-tRNA formyltransferase